MTPFDLVVHSRTTARDDLRNFILQREFDMDRK
jgi:hypothetical protein